ncbi:UNC5C-like protein [Mytilus galloprovincialis]|uniref:Netrin receptor UNC5 n=2 Tax=Mytilus galloprovincialis TaxID=29158 RepID=A0A8B6EQ80_MYTGA|nr:Hypothetical predicted protein [Mytilus galloprovincialis]
MAVTQTIKTTTFHRFKRDDEKHAEFHESSDLLEGHGILIVIFLLIILVIVAVVILVIMCRKGRFRRQKESSNENHTRCHCFLNRGFQLEQGVSSQNCSCQQPRLAECMQNRYPINNHNGFISYHNHGQFQNIPNTNFRPSHYDERTNTAVSGFQGTIRQVPSPIQNECEQIVQSHASPSVDETVADYSNSENEDDEEETHPISIPSQELFANIPPQLLQVCERSKTIHVQNKEVVFISRRVTDKGDNLVLDGMGISLFVPPEAVKKNETKIIVLVLNWDLSDNPYMSDKQALVSPVVYVGPHDLKLDKPCTLSFKHCSFDPRHIQIMKSETELIESKDWVEHCSLTENSGACVVTPDECQLQIDSFTLYTCLQSPTGSDDCKKWLQVAAFSSPLHNSINHQQVRVYFLNKTPCALQWAIQNEAKFGGQLMGPEKVYLFYGNAQDMFIALRYLSDGWNNVDKEVEEHVPYINIWHGKCPHITMCFKKNCRPRELTFKLFLYQYTLENEGGNFIAHVTEENKRDLHSGSGKDNGKQEIVVTLPSMRNDLKQDTDENRPYSEPQVHLHFTTPDVRLEKVEQATKDYYPHDLKVKLKVLLDPHSAFDRNWKALASALGKDKCIRYLETMNSPTENLLSHAESMKLSLETLADILSCIQREDASTLVKEYIPQTTSNGRAGHESTESSYSYNIPEYQ